MVELGGYEGCLGAVVTVAQGEIRMSMPAQKYGEGCCDVFVALGRLRKGIVAGQLQPRIVTCGYPSLTAFVYSMPFNATGWRGTNLQVYSAFV